MRIMDLLQAANNNNNIVYVGHDRIAGTSQVPKSSSPVPNLYTARVYRSPPQATSDRLAIICVSLFGQLYTKVRIHSLSLYSNQLWLILYVNNYVFLLVS